MLVVLPMLAFALLTIAFRRRNAGWREAALYASLPWSLFLALITEALTQFRFLTRGGVAWCWLAFAVVCCVWMWRIRRGPKTEHRFADKAALQTGEWVVLISMAVIAGLVCLTALASAPNNWDAMEYHLPRVVEWAAHRGIQFYPTIDWSQLCQSPFAEYVMLHVDLLSGSDRLLALVQWFAYLGSIAGVSLIARELGGGRRSQFLAAVLTATLPSALLGASSTKNDCVAAYWIVAAAYFLLRWRESQDWANTLAIGSALGLAIFTKGTSYVFLPCVVVACGMIWTTKQKQRFLLRLPAIAALAVLICLPIWVRNYQFVGNPLGLPYFYGVGDINGRMFGTARVTPPETAANILRNVALHVGTPSDRMNALSTRAFSSAIRLVGVDPDAPGQMIASQLGYTPRFQVRFNPKNEVMSEDPVHLLLFVLALVLWFYRRRQIGAAAGWFALGTIGAFVLYCALLRWSPWNARYQIPVFLLAAGFTAVVVDKSLPKWTGSAIAALLLVLAFPLAIANDTRPLITHRGLTGSALTTPRDETYFFDSHQELAPSWIAAANAARDSGCRSFGLDANRMHFDYPMMALLLKDGVSRQIRYLDVQNSSARYPEPSSQPVCMVVCLRCLHDSAAVGKYSAELSQMQAFGDVVLFSRPER